MADAKLIDQVKDRCRVLGYSAKTRETYCRRDWLKMWLGGLCFVLKFAASILRRKELAAGTWTRQLTRGNSRERFNVPAFASE